MDYKELRQVLKAEGVSQRLLAKGLELDERTIRRYVAGDLKIPRVVHLAVLAIFDHEENLGGKLWPK
jgi:transcriptional regulator with XRE-family HTH domain